MIQLLMLLPPFILVIGTDQPPKPLGLLEIHQVLMSRIPTDAEHVALFGAIAAMRQTDVDALNKYLELIPEHNLVDDWMMRVIGKKQRGDLLDAVRQRYDTSHRDEFRRFHAQAISRQGQLPPEATADAACDLTGILASAAIAADDSGHHSIACRLARAAWKCFQTCPDDRRDVDIVEVAKACAIAEMQEEVRSLLESMNSDSFNLSSVVFAISQQEVRHNRISNAVGMLSKLSDIDRDNIEDFWLVKELLRNGDFEKALEFVRLSAGRGSTRQLLAEELARQGRMKDAVQFLDKVTPLGILQLKARSLGRRLRNGMPEVAIKELKAIVSEIDKAQNVSENDSTYHVEILLLTLPCAIELNEAEILSQILDMLPQQIEASRYDPIPFTRLHFEPYVEAASMLAVAGLTSESDTFFRTAWGKSREFFGGRQGLVVTMNQVGRFTLCRDLAREADERFLRMLAAYCEGFWTKGTKENEFLVDTQLAKIKDGELAFALCRQLGCIAAEKGRDDFEFPGWSE